MTLEFNFDVTFTAALALREKQIQQNYRPIIGVHKWFARRPGTVFRNLLLAEFSGTESLETSYWHAHEIKGVIADPFMGGGTPIYEANRLGLSVIGADVNPMAYWIVRQSLAELDLKAFTETAASVAEDVERDVGELYLTTCTGCGSQAVVKYFLWVKTQECPDCGADNDLFPGYLLAEAVRHPRHVVACRHCGALNEYESLPTVETPARCGSCMEAVHVAGPARRSQTSCRSCASLFRYPRIGADSPPRHRMWALEYHCKSCKPGHSGRFFKTPDAEDLNRHELARARLLELGDALPVPQNEIPPGDESGRLHRWGYRFYRQMFNERQLLSLGLLLRRIQNVQQAETRHALLTVFSDSLRYQNMLCRYDTYALKCQDIFSVHGFPVGLVQCENNLLGIPKVGSGSFRHFVEKYRRAKLYCEAPFETIHHGKSKKVVPIRGEKIRAHFVDRLPQPTGREALLIPASATRVPLAPQSLDGVFTDPPYYDNVQYAELMDFCFTWLRLGLNGESRHFTHTTTRTPDELTGNQTLGRGPEHFTAGLAAIFSHYAGALKPGAPFVFTYHHNDPEAYVPLVVAILDAGLDCTATLPAPAEMSASLHIAGTDSSIMDSVFVCRNSPVAVGDADIKLALTHDAEKLHRAGLRLTDGDRRCLVSGHMARVAINRLRSGWQADLPLVDRMTQARQILQALARDFIFKDLSAILPLPDAAYRPRQGEQLEASV